MEQKKIMGWRGSANSLGGIIYPVVGGFLGGFSWHLPFVIYTIGVPLGFLAILFVPDVYSEKPPDEGNHSSVLSIFRTTPILYAIYGTMFLSNIMLYAIVIFLPQVLETIGISDPLHISIFMSFMIFAAGLTSFNYRRIKAALSYRTILLLALALWIAALFTMSQATFGLLIFVALAFFGIGLGVIIPTIPVWIGEIVPAAFRGRFSSYMGTFGFIGQFISPIVFAPVLVLLGLNGVFLVSAGIGMLVLIVFWILL
jgi:MFS family permease